MKFRVKQRVIPGEYTPEGAAKVQIDKTPVLPIDTQQAALRAALGIVLALTVIAISWSTWSIGELLGGGIGYGAAVIYDMGWAVALLLEYLARYDKNKRDFPKKLGWALLVITMLAIGYHGYITESLGLGAGIFGATISLIAKVMWLGVMKHVNAELTDQDQDQLAKEISAAQTKAAVATVRRTTSRIEQRAALELLAMEKERAEVAEAFGIGTATVERVEAPAQTLVLEPPTLADMKQSDAIKFVINQHPELEPPEIADLLGDHGVDVKADYVKQVISRMKPEEIAEVVELRK